MRLTKFEAQLYIACTASALGGLINMGRAKLTPTSHACQDYARAEVEEWRIRKEAYRLRRMKHRQRAARLRSKRRSDRK